MYMDIYLITFWPVHVGDWGAKPKIFFIFAITVNYTGYIHLDENMSLEARPGKKTKQHKPKQSKKGSSLQRNFIIWRDKIKKYTHLRETHTAGKSTLLEANFAQLAGK